MKKTILILIVLLGLTFTVRIIVAFNTYIMTEDGPFYLNTARELSEGNYKEITGKLIFHPLYPALISVTHILLNPIFNIDWEWAGMLISIIFATLAIIPLYFIGRRYFPSPVVIAGCILYAFHHRAVELSTSIFTTGVFIGIFIFALWVTIIALESNKYRYFLISGLLSFVMYLIRPDGVIFLAVSVLGFAANSLRPTAKNKITTNKKVAAIFMLIVPWLCLMPLYLSIYPASGGTAFTNKVSVKKMVGLTENSGLHDDARNTVDGVTSEEGSRPVKPVSPYLNGLYLLAYYFIKGANPLLLLLLAVGFVGYFRRSTTAGSALPRSGSLVPGESWGQKPETGETQNTQADITGGLGNAYRGDSFFIWLVFIMFTLVFFRYAISYERLSTRYTVPLLIILLAWAASGLYSIAVVVSRLSRSRGKEATKKIYYGLLIVVIVFFSFYTFRPVRKFKVIEKTTGELLNKYHSARTDAGNRPAVIITKMQRLAYYAGGVNVIPDAWSKDNQKMDDIMGSLKDAIRQKDVDYLVLDSRIIRNLPNLEKELANLDGDIKAELISQYFDKVGGDYYRVYRFLRKR
ncbi:MAG: glycosyltransferase family 39 protein [Planctomycetes bacterium]|nr:glycosyltransferase family 39 protein [Planctomycetota bacterium]